MRVLGRSALERALPMERCIEAMAEAMRATTAGEADVPLRTYLHMREGGGKLVVMPGAVTSLNVFGLKIVSKFPRPANSPHGSHVGMVTLFDARDGLPLALLEGGLLTEIRTAAASALATRELAREDARTLAILGTGAQAWRHALAIPLVRPIEVVRLWGRTRANAEQLATALRARLGVRVEVAASAELAVRGADIVCTTTSAAEPLLFGRWLSPGMHINLVGSAIPTTAEVDAECVHASRVYVDSRTAAAAEAGELRAALVGDQSVDDIIVGELGEVLLGRIPARTSAHQITLYKSLGNAAQDVVAARAALDTAQRLDLGTHLDLAEIMHD